jgi:low affinity Fe/Cu permease
VQRKPADARSYRQPLGVSRRPGQYRKHGFGHVLERLSSSITRWTGGSFGFAIACLAVLAWLLTGPIFHYSDTWQLVINTGTTVVTFLMVFLVQRTQNKDSLAMQLKLNEILAALQGASNRMVQIEDLDEEDLTVLQQYYKRLSQMAAQERKLTESHSIAEAEERHAWKARKKIH